MSKLKIYRQESVYTAAQNRIKETFRNFEKIYVSYSGGKDSTVMIHMVMKEAKLQNRKVGVLIIDLEAQYEKTIQHVQEIINLYREYIDLHWVCLPLSLRNAVSNFQPKWTCWDESAKELWVRNPPEMSFTVNNNPYKFFVPGMEFEEFMVLFGEYYANGKNCAAFIGIRADESLNRFRTIASKNKETFNGLQYTTKTGDCVYNVYPIYDWKTQDIWKFHQLHKNLPYNSIYDLMYKAGLSIHEMRLCQPYGDDQRRGLWLYHILEGKTWSKVVQRVNGTTSGALYIQENGNITGYNKIVKPDNHTWQSFCKLLLATMPTNLRDHYQERFIKFLQGWKNRGYTNGIPDAAPEVLEKKQWAPSWRRMCRVLLRNDYWCKGLGFTQPKSEAYGVYLRGKQKASELGTTVAELEVLQ